MYSSKLIILFSLVAVANATVTQFVFNDPTSGAVQKNGVNYFSFIHWGNLSIRHASLLNIARNGFWQIPTGNGTIPTDAIIDDVEMNYVLALTQPSNPCQHVEIYAGNFIGGTLTGNAATFNGGTDLLFEIQGFGAGNWFSLAQTCTSDTACWPGLFVNKTSGGTMDIKVACTDSDMVDRGVTYERSNAKTQFRITWHLPNAANVSLTNPANNTNSLVNESVNYQCNASEELTVKNLTFYFQNEWQTWAANYTNTTEGPGINNTVTFVNLTAGNYTWNCQACITNGSCYFSQYNYTHETKRLLTPPKINFIPPTPANNSIINTSFTIVNVSLDKQPQACILHWFNGVTTETPQIWVPNSGSQTVTGLATSNGALLHTTTTGNTPTGTAVDLNGNVWVSTGGDKVTKINPTTGTADANYTVSGTTQGIAVDSFGNVWVAANGAYQLSRINTATNTVDLNVTLPNPAYGVAADANGFVYAAQFTFSVISKIDATTGKVVDNFSTPTDTFELTADANGILWATSHGRYITRLNPSTGGSSQIDTLTEDTAGITVDINGFVWVVSANSFAPSKQLTQLDQSGVIVNQYGIADNAGTYGLASTQDGGVWVSNFDANNITNISSTTGTAVATFNVGTQPMGFGDMTGLEYRMDVLRAGIGVNYTMTIVNDATGSWAYYNKTNIVEGMQNYYYVICNTSIGEANQSETRWVRFQQPTPAAGNQTIANVTINRKPFWIREELDEDTPVRTYNQLGWVFFTLPVLTLILLGRNKTTQS